MAKTGKFIVIDGIDGSGKATQVELLLQKLMAKGLMVKKIDFPRYTDNFFGKFIGECLTGQHGNFIEVDPRIASVLYAADRFETSEKIKGWLRQGYTVIADRYVSSNQIHQGGKLKDNKSRAEFLKWLDIMEYDIFKIPRPDAIIFLHLPVKLSMKLMEQRKNKAPKKSRKYLEGKKDLAEEDFKHLENSRKSAISIVKKNNNWQMIECSKNNEILSREEINNGIYKAVSEILKI